MHLDQWAALVPGAKTRGVLDSSYFFAPNGSYPFLIREAFEFHQSVAAAACLAANQNSTWWCAYPKVWDNGPWPTHATAPATPPPHCNGSCP
jgi:hypothetical protein